MKPTLDAYYSTLIAFLHLWIIFVSVQVSESFSSQTVCIADYSQHRVGFLLLLFVSRIVCVMNVLTLGIIWSSVDVYSSQMEVLRDCENEEECLRIY